MVPLHLLVISADDETGSWLVQHLPERRFRVKSARPGPTLIPTVRSWRPQVAVVDGIDRRREAAQMEVALLKDQSPGVQVIALCERSSELDAQVIEQGIFYYLAGCSRGELLRVVEAAAREWKES
jgi:DNA-binding response OmpR family regulator